MSFDIGAITGQLVLDSNKFKSAIDQAKKDMKSFEGAVLRSQDQLKKLGRTMTIVGASITAVSGLLVKMSADVQESENLFEVSMGNMAGSAKAWSQELSRSLKLNEFEVRKTVGIFNVMTKSMGLSEKAAFQMSKEMTQLGFDMASFFNLRPEESFQKLQAAIAGESEPLKRLGIIVNETTIKTWALNNGLIRQGQELTEAQKVIARYGVIMEATNAAQGDLARTLDSTTNRFRTLASIATNLGVSIGNKLLPAVNILVGWMIRLVEVSQKFVDTFPNISSAIVLVTAAFGLMALAIGPVLIALPGIAAAAAAAGVSIKVFAMASMAVMIKFALIVGAVYLAFKKWDMLKAIFYNFSANLNEMLAKATRSIANFVDKISEVPLIGDKFKGIRDSLDKTAQNFQENSDFMREKVVESFDAQMQKDRERLNAIVNSNDQIKLSFKDMFDQINDEAEKNNQKLKSGMKDWLERLKEDFNIAEEVGRRTFNLLADSFSELFFDAMTGEIKSFSELFADFGRRILKIMADIAAQWLAVKIITGIGGIFSGAANAAGGIAAVGASAASSTATTASGALSAGLESSFGNFGQNFNKMQGLSLGSFADGLDRVPATGFYKLHKDEQVVPSRYSGPDRPPINLTIENHITPEGVASTLVQRPAKDTIVNIIDNNALRGGPVRQRILDR